MEVTMKKLLDTIELQRISNEKFSEYLETLKLGVIKPVTAAVESVVDLLGINADNDQHMPIMPMDNTLDINADKHMPLHLDKPIILDADNNQHMQSSLLIDDDNAQHMPLLHKPLDNLSYSDSLVIDAGNDQHMPLVQKPLFDAENV